MKKDAPPAARVDVPPWFTSDFARMKLQELVAALNQIDAESDTSQTGSRQLELVKSDAPLNEVTIFGNREGFIYLALVCLSLAGDERQGAHYQFDQTSIFRRIDTNLVLARSIDDSALPTIPK